MLPSPEGKTNDYRISRGGKKMGKMNQNKLGDMPDSVRLIIGILAFDFIWDFLKLPLSTASAQPQDHSLVCNNRNGHS